MEQIFNKQEDIWVGGGGGIFASEVCAWGHGNNQGRKGRGGGMFLTTLERAGNWHRLLICLLLDCPIPADLIRTLARLLLFVLVGDSYLGQKAKTPKCCKTKLFTSRIHNEIFAASEKDDTVVENKFFA